MTFELLFTIKFGKNFVFTHSLYKGLNSKGGIVVSQWKVVI